MVVKAKKAKLFSLFFLVILSTNAEDQAQMLESETKTFQAAPSPPDLTYNFEVDA